MLDSISQPASRRSRSLLTGGTLLAALLVCSVLLPFHSRAMVRAQAAQVESKTELWPISIDYPLDGSIFPPGITPPTFLWRDAAGESWQVDIAFADNSAPIHVQPKAERMRIGTIDPECISPTNELPKLTPAQAASWAWIRPKPWTTTCATSSVNWPI